MIYEIESTRYLIIEKGMKNPDRTLEPEAVALIPSIVGGIIFIDELSETVVFKYSPKP